jgi:hypothetical protein
MHPYDPSYRRLRYIRYADDWLLGYDGTREEAEEIKGKIGVWLQENLKLTLSEEKTLITHAVKGAARFLGYQIVNQQYNGHIYKGRRRSLNGTIGLRVPEDVIEKKCAQYLKQGKPTHRPKLLEHLRPRYAQNRTEGKRVRGVREVIGVAFSLRNS